jgi:hypothetical protein
MGGAGSNYMSGALTGVSAWSSPEGGNWRAGETIGPEDARPVFNALQRLANNLPS